MSHHLRHQMAREDRSLNLCDFYLFDGPSGKTVMAMTVNPDVGLSAPDTLHPEGLYAFRFDLNGDAREEVTFKFRFGEPRHGDGSEHTHIQPFVVRKATVNDAFRGTPERVWLRVKPVRSQVIRVFVRCWDCSRAICGKCCICTSITTVYEDQRYDGDAFCISIIPLRGGMLRRLRWGRRAN